MLQSDNEYRNWHASNQALFAEIHWNMKDFPKSPKLLVISITVQHLAYTECYLVLHAISKFELKKDFLV